MKKILSVLSTLIFLFSIILVAFVGGVYYDHTTNIYVRVRNAVLDLRGVFFGKPHHVGKARYDIEGVEILDRNSIFPGYTLITGIWKSSNGDSYIAARLYDLEGKIKHEWKIDPEKLPKTSLNMWSKYIHGSKLFPNGDILLNLEYYGLIKLDKDSNIIWSQLNGAHHSIFVDEEENIWVGGTEVHSSSVPEFPSLVPPFKDNQILKVSPDGKLIKNLSILKILYESGYDGLIREKTGDILHLNDIEVLGSDKAGNFPMFESGDILVSLRNINSILVIDGKSEKVKWSMTYPFVYQHDPDFTKDGNIIVFDNHSKPVDPEAAIKGSRILLIDPNTNTVKTMYGHEDDEYFYSSYAGKVQQLANGNLLITEARAGRVMETSPEGSLVWTWTAPKWDENSISEIMEGSRYEDGYLKFLNESP